MTAQTAVTPDEGVNDLEEILQATDRTVLIDGIECRVRRLKTREFFLLMRILTKAMGHDLVAVFDTKDPDQLAGRFMGAMIAAIPMAELEFLLFVNRMVEPVDENQADKLKPALQNPELEEMMSIIQVVVEQEAGELTRLGKVAQTWWETVGPTLKKKG